MFLLTLIAFGVPIVAVAGFAMALRSRRRLEEVERREAALTDAIATLALRVKELERPPVREAVREEVAQPPPPEPERVVPSPEPVMPAPEPARERAAHRPLAPEAHAPESPDVEPEARPHPPEPAWVERVTMAAVRGIDWEGLVGVKLFS